MSIIGGPQTGYSDFQRTVALDQSTYIFWNPIAIPANGIITEGPYNTTTFEFVSMLILQVTGTMTLTFNWYADALYQHQIDTDTFTLQAGIGLDWKLQLPTKAPYVSITLRDTSGFQNDFYALWQLTNRGQAWIGQQFVVPTVPDPTPIGHPSTELQFATSALAANGNVRAAPGVGKRYRVFSAHITPVTGLEAYMADSVTGEGFIIAQQAASVQLSFEPTGLPLSANAAIKYVVAAGTGTSVMGVTYTIEII